MKNPVTIASSNARSKTTERLPNLAQNSTKGATIIRCGFCQNTFFAVPRQAVCLKCKRPANKPLSLSNKLLSLILFPVGLLKALLMRSSQPYAASQALMLSILGAAAWAALYFLALK